MNRQPTVNRLVQNAKKEVGKTRFENVEESFRQYAEKEMLRIRLQQSINRAWLAGGEVLTQVNERKTERWLKQRVKELQELTP